MQTQNQTAFSREKRIQQLLSMAWETENSTRISGIADQILELDPNNIEALIMKADRTKDNTKRLDFLERGIKALKSCKTPDTERKAIFKLALYQRLAYCFSILRRHKESLEACNIAINFSEESDDIDEDANYLAMKTLRYRLLIEFEEWQKILEYTMQDEDHTAGWAYARLISAWILSPEPKAPKCATMFFDALIKAPDIPFYMLGLMDEPEESEDDSATDDFNFALTFYGIVKITDEFRDWFIKGTVLFGLLSNRFEGDERDYMMDVLEALGGLDDYERMLKILVEGDDAAVIEAMAANKCLRN